MSSDNISNNWPLDGIGIVWCCWWFGVCVPLAMMLKTNDDQWTIIWQYFLCCGTFLNLTWQRHPSQEDITGGKPILPKEIHQTNISKLIILLIKNYQILARFTFNCIDKLSDYCLFEHSIGVINEDQCCYYFIKCSFDVIRSNMCVNIPMKYWRSNDNKGF